MALSSSRRGQPSAADFEPAVTEVLNECHRFVVEVGTEAAGEILAEMLTRPAEPAGERGAESAVAQAAAQQGRQTDTADNDVKYDSGGLRFKLHVLDERDYKLEIVLQEDEPELEVELTGAATRAVHARGSDHRALVTERARLAVAADPLAATWPLTNSSRSSRCPVTRRSATASSARRASRCTVSDAPRS